LIRRALSVGFSLPELTTILNMRDGGEIPCRRVQAIAESKLERVKQQIQNLVEMRDQLEAILTHWNVKLARTRGRQIARLLEDLPAEVRRNGLRSPFRKKIRKDRRP
jgi:DNA-binding transcriptional MerR regulator